MGRPSARSRSHSARLMKYSSSPKKLPNVTFSWFVSAKSPPMATTRSTMPVTRTASTHRRSVPLMSLTAALTIRTMATVNQTVSGEKA